MGETNCWTCSWRPASKDTYLLLHLFLLLPAVSSFLRQSCSFACWRARLWRWLPFGRTGCSVNTTAPSSRLVSPLHLSSVLACLKDFHLGFDRTWLESLGWVQILREQHGNAVQQHMEVQMSAAWKGTVCRPEDGKHDILPESRSLCELHHTLYGVLSGTVALHVLTAVATQGPMQGERIKLVWCDLQ